MLDSKHPDFWVRLKKEFNWNEAMGCFSYIIGPNTKAFCEQNSIYLGNCMFCIEKNHKARKPHLNAIDVAFPS
jgi:hypothetical protein